MAETIQHVEDMVDNSPVIDVHDTFHYYRQLLADLKAKIDARFELTRDPSTLDLQAYGGYPGGAGGSLEAHSGPEIDWLVHSWIGNPGAGFANLHLTAWLGPHVKVPHLGIALLVWPGGWFYLDSVPRTNMVEDADYFDRYYAGLDEEWLELRADPEFEYFVSRAGFIRASLSPTAYCYSFERSQRNLEIVSQRAHAHVDRWLRWVDEAEPVPAVIDALRTITGPVAGLLDLGNVALVGHSAGGTVILQSARFFPEVKAVAAYGTHTMAATMLGWPAGTVLPGIVHPVDDTAARAFLDLDATTDPAATRAALVDVTAAFLDTHLRGADTDALDKALQSPDIAGIRRR